MGHITNHERVVANGHVGVMVFLVRHPGNDVGKGHGLVKILEGKVSLQSAILKAPPRDLG